MVQVVVLTLNRLSGNGDATPYPRDLTKAVLRRSHGRLSNSIINRRSALADRGTPYVHQSNDRSLR